jgi:hypothetical protein
MWATSAIKIHPKYINNHPFGENSPNLVTLHLGIESAQAQGFRLARLKKLGPVMMLHKHVDGMIAQVLVNEGNLQAYRNIDRYLSTSIHCFGNFYILHFLFLNKSRHLLCGCAKLAHEHVVGCIALFI